jgi:hypothetical protein
MLPDERPWRSRAALLVALVLHGVAGGGSYLLGRASVSMESPMAVVETDIEVDEGSAIPRSTDSIEPVDSPTDIESRRAKSQERAASAGRSVAPGSPRRESASPGEPETAKQGGDALDPSAGPERQGEPRRGVELGINPGNWSMWVDPTGKAEQPPAPPATRAPAHVSQTGGLAEALEAHDHEVGLGPAGRVLSAALEAGRSEVAPAIGNATFTITVLKTGAINVELGAASSNIEGWRKVADNMAAAIKKKPPRIDGGRNGVRIGVKLVAEQRLPAPGGALSIARATLTFDVSNIGAPAQRFVSAHVTSQTLF